MAEEDHEEIGTNEELQMYGWLEMTRTTTCVRTMRCSIEAPINLSYGPNGRALAVEDENSCKRAHPSTSNVWLDYEKIFKTVTNNKVKYEAKSIVLRCTLLSLVVALATSPSIGINALRGMKKLTCLSPRFLLILMVVCIIESTVPRLLILVD